jgi:threonine/homoserine/homoserine lactone efflux protein
MDLILLIKGVIAGFIIAAPVGPVGILCVQRTLEKSILAGIIAGSGAAVADTIFGAVAAFGLTFIAEFLLRHEELMRIFGGALLVGLGVHGFAKKVSVAATPTSVGGSAGDAISSFLLAMTNPITILTFSPVFLAVGAVVSPEDRRAAGTLILGVAGGSLLWWLMLCGLASLFRRRLNDNRMRIIYRVSAGMILFFGIVVLASTTPFGRDLMKLAKPLGL